MKTVFAAFAVALFALAGTTSMAGSVVNVKITDYAYTPNFLQLSAGDTVVFTNAGKITHDVDAHIETDNCCNVPGAPGIPVAVDVPTMVNLNDPTNPVHVEADVGPGETVAVNFDTPGVYIINCNEGLYHNQMKLVVVVLS